MGCGSSSLDGDYQVPVTNLVSSAIEFMDMQTLDPIASGSSAGPEFPTMPRKAGPLVPFPVSSSPGNQGDGSAWEPGKWSEQKNRAYKMLKEESGFHGGEQILFCGYVMHADGKRLLIVTGMGRMFLVKLGAFSCRDEKVAGLQSAHVASLRGVSCPEPGTVRATFAATTIDIKCSPEGGAALVSALRMAAVVCNGTSDPSKLPGFEGAAGEAPSLPPPPADGGFHSSFIMHHNGLMPSEPASNWSHEPTNRLYKNMVPEQVWHGRAPGSWHSRTALSLVQAAAMNLELDLTKWDDKAIAAACLALRHNPAFLSLVCEGVSMAPRHIAQVLATNTALIALEVPASSEDPNAVSRGGGAPSSDLGAMARAMEANPGSQLSFISMKGQPFGAEGSGLARALAKLPTGQLVSLDLSSCQMPAQASSAIMGALQKQGALKGLKFGGNQLAGQASGDLVNVLVAAREAGGIEDLDLAGTGVDAGMFGAIATWQQSGNPLLPSIRSLNLSRNAFTQPMWEAVKMSLGTLESIGLSGSLDLSQSPSGALASVLSDPAVARSSAQFDLSENPRAMAGGRPLVELLHKGGCPKAINVSKGGMGDEALQAVFQAIPNSGIEGIDVSEMLQWDGAANGFAMHLANMACPQCRNSSLICTCVPGLEGGLGQLDKVVQFASSTQGAPGNAKPRMDTSGALARLLGSGASFKALSIRGLFPENPAFAYGPLAAVPLHFGLPFSTTLVSLDVSGNGILDVGMTALGRALRKNRSLTSLKADNNGVTHVGLKEFRGCLYGNMKIVDYPLPHKDIKVSLDQYATMYQESLTEEVAARMHLKSAYVGMRGGCRYDVKNQALAMLSAAKKKQSAARGGKDKLRKVTAQIMAGVLRNQEASVIKGSGKAGKATAKLQSKAEQQYAKIKAKEDTKKAAVTAKVWETRHKLLVKWRKAMDAAGKHMPVAYFKDWLRQWAKPYFTPDGFKQMWSLVPPEQQEHFTPLKEDTEAAFAREADLSSGVKELAAQRADAEEEIAMHMQAREFHAAMAQQNPKAVAAPPVDPGIVQTRVPGKDHGQFGSGYHTDWNGRYHWVINDLNSNIGKGPPPDYKWDGHQVADPVKGPSLVWGQPQQAAPLQQAPGGYPPQQGGAPGYGAPAGGIPGQIASPAGYPPQQGGGYPPQQGGGYPPQQGGYPPQQGGGYPPQQGGGYPPQQGGYPPQQGGGYPPQQGGYPPQQGGGYPPQPMPGYGNQVQGAQGYRPPPQAGRYGAYAGGGGMMGGGMGGGRYGNQGGRYGNQGGNNNMMMMGGAGMMGYMMMGGGGGGRYGGNRYGHGGHHHGGHHHHNHHHHGGGGSSAPAVNPTGGEEGTITDGGGAEEVVGEEPPEDMAMDDMAFDEDMGGGDEGIGGDEMAGMDEYGGAGPRDLPGSNGQGGAKGKARVPSGTRAAASRLICDWFEAVGRLDAARPPSAVEAEIEHEWEARARAAEDAVLGRANLIDYPARILRKAGSTAASPSAVAAVTQCSFDRLPRLEALALAWGGPVCAAVYVPHPAGSPPALSAVAAVAAAAAALPPGSSATAVFPPAHAEEQEVAAYDALYPVNHLRNVALDSARTEIVFLVDVDFVPSEGLHAALCGDAPRGSVSEIGLSAPALRRQCAGGRLFVVPAFEDGGEAALAASTAPEILAAVPRDATALRAARVRGEATPFHVGHFAKGHGPTDYGRWAASRRPYAVGFEEYYEPYVVAARASVPRYDARFRGYGMNKVSHLYSCAARGLEFSVLPRAFVVAPEHKKSASWQAVFGDGADSRHKVRVALLYRRMKAELAAAPFHVHPLAPRAADRKDTKEESEDEAVRCAGRKRAARGGCGAEEAARQRRRCTAVAIA